VAGIALVEVGQHVLVVMGRGQRQLAAGAHFLAADVHRNIALNLLDALQFFN
jgi:hypothetical protein